MKVPFNDLHAWHDEVKSHFYNAIEQRIFSSALVGRQPVQQFEENSGAHCRARFTMGVSNGTDALRLLLLAHGAGHISSSNRSMPRKSGTLWCLVSSSFYPRRKLGAMRRSDYRRQMDR